MQAWIERLGRPAAGSKVLLTVAFVALVGLIGLIDYVTGTELAVTIFYLIPIALGAWFVGPRTGRVLAFLSAGAWLLADVYGGHLYQSPIIPPWNAAVCLSFFLIIAATISVRQRTERRLRELMEIKSEFTSMVSHELRTPLACIKEGIDIVADGTCGSLSAAQEAQLCIAKRNVDRLARLLDQVLTYQRLEARRLELSREAADLNRIATQAADAFELSARRSGLRIALDLASELPRVDCDPDRISQVLCNLLSNALKFSERGTIHVRTERTAQGVRVLVEDQGPGIPRAELPRLFQGFVRIRRAGARPVEGTGLGLAIARQIVELHGGEIGVESQPGRGSSFHFTLPVASSAVRPELVGSRT
jgi:signal transduction histidine kinase